MNQLTQLVTSLMVMLCWSKEEALGFIKFVKFWQQTGSNMMAVTNLAICMNLALIVSVRLSPHQRER